MVKVKLVFFFKVMYLLDLFHGQREINRIDNGGYGTLEHNINTGTLPFFFRIIRFRIGMV